MLRVAEVSYLSGAALPFSSIHRAAVVLHLYL